MVPKLDLLYISWDTERKDLLAHVGTATNEDGHSLTVEVSVPYKSSMTLGELEQLAISGARQLLRTVAG
jgi:hypothetical protein